MFSNKDIINDIMMAKDIGAELALIRVNAQIREEIDQREREKSLLNQMDRILSRYRRQIAA